MINKREQSDLSHNAARPSFHTCIEMEYAMKWPILQIPEVVKCQADNDKLQEKGSSQGSVSEWNLTNDLCWEGGEENASEKKIYAIYKMMCSELSFSGQ